MKTKVTLIFFLALNFLNAQSLGSKWMEILVLSDQVVYVDTLSIKQVENQISVLSNSIYKQPQMIPSLNKEAASVKSQILFNAALKKYTVIGTLYYDKSQRILGETSLPGFASNSENFSMPIEGNEVMTAIYNKAAEYLKIGLNPINEKETKKTADIKKVTETKKEPVVTTIPIKNKIEEVKKEENDSVKALDRVALYLSKKDSVQKAAQQPQVQTKPVKESTEKNNEQISQKPLTDSKKKNDVELTTSNEHETNPISTIFTDGSKYSFQISSWKNKAKAESEVKRLKSQGHNVFIAEGIVRGSTWYRVRIGYFNSIEETEAYMKRVKSE
jgi:cell division protein FtsN